MKHMGGEQMSSEINIGAETGSARVLVSISSGPRKGKTLLFTGRNVCVFGRAGDSFEILDKMDQTVGRHHFSLEINPPEVKLRDLQSLNGTYVNGRKIGGADDRGERPESPAILLQHGDKIQAGADVFVVAIETPVTCDRCGNATDLYAAAGGGRSASKAFCSVCHNALSSKTVVQETAFVSAPPPPDAPPSPARAGIQCNLCGKTESGENAQDDNYLCLECLDGLATDKKALTTYLDAASRDERKTTAYSINDFEFRKLIGERRYGAVYLAKEKNSKLDVMVRIALANGIADAGFQEVMNERLNVIRNLRHPNLVKIIACGYVANVLYVASECFGGENISQHISARKNRLETHEAIQIMTQALEGLAFIHQNGLTHGDLQPENLFIHSGRMGFECRLSDAGLLCGLWDAGLRTPYAIGHGDSTAFIPPELRDRPACATPAGDVWSIAAVFYHMLSGKLPLEEKRDSNKSVSFNGQAIAPIARHRPNIMPELAQLIDVSLHTEPALRPKNAVHMLERMKSVQSNVIHLTITL